MPREVCRRRMAGTLSFPVKCAQNLYTGVQVPENVESYAV